MLHNRHYHNRRSCENNQVIPVSAEENPELIAYVAAEGLQATLIVVAMNFVCLCTVVSNICLRGSGVAALGSRQRLCGSRTYEASGRDMHTLLFSFLDELLFVFSTELFAPKLLDISCFDQGRWRITATGCCPAHSPKRTRSGKAIVT